MSFESKKSEGWTQTASIRLTHKYADGWSGEDEWEEVGEYQNMGSVEFHRGEGTALSVLIIRNLSIPPDKLNQALMDTISGSHCRHDHDCCGCWSRSVRQVTPLEGGYVAVVVSYHQNI